MNQEEQAFAQASPAQNVFVCGGGHQGLAMAAHLALNRIQVTLWNRTKENIKEVIDTKKIICKGIVQGTAVIENASTNMEEVVSDFVMITTPSSAHRTIAKQIAPFVHKDMVIVLNPGRTFGAIDFSRTLAACGVKEMPHIAETQTIVYTCRRNDRNTASIFALKKNVKIAALKKSSIAYIMERMPKCLLPYFEPVNSVAITSLDNIGMILHCAPVMMNIGWIETEKTDFKYYYDGITQSIAKFLEKVDAERIAVAKAIGYPVESLETWLKRTYEVTGNSLYDCIRNNEAYREIDAPPTIQCRYILEDVPNGLVPLESVGKQAGVKTPNISIIIDLACAVLEQDLRQEGRQFALKTLQENF